ncbi:MAG: Zinc-binding domain of primase-helicase, partial [Pseudomonadota bacterium]
MTNSILEFVPNLKQKSRTEYAGPCPWCGGKDRFIVWPAQGNGGRFYC